MSNPPLLHYSGRLGSVRRLVKRVVAGCALTLAFAVGCLCLALFLEYHSPRNQRWQTLIMDIEHQNTRAVEAALDYGTAPNDYPNIDEDDMAPLNEAASAGNIEIVRILRNSGHWRR